MLVVKGGPAGSGSRLPMQPTPTAWVCTNGHENRGFCARCMVTGCNVKRPK